MAAQLGPLQEQQRPQFLAAAATGRLSQLAVVVLTMGTPLPLQPHRWQPAAAAAMPAVLPPVEACPPLQHLRLQPLAVTATPAGLLLLVTGPGEAALLPPLPGCQPRRKL